MTAQPIPIRGPRIAHDGLLKISVGTRRTSTSWKGQELLWSQLLERLSNCQRTQETLKEYRAMPKSAQDDIKDVGGFVGGELRGGRRLASAVISRQLVTLDADDVSCDLWGLLTLCYDYAACVYSTHSHEPSKPRLRIVIPLARPVSPEEYQAIARRLADGLGIDQFDPTTFEPHRLMYWPSAPRDVEPVFAYQDGPWADPDAILATYSDWRDPTSWPAPAREVATRQKSAEKAEDPTTKKGIVGAFCRTYDIHQAIETFLADVYTPAGDGRYTYIPGSTSGGLVVYDGGLFAYSHHGTDPCSGRLVNAFDLVRIHKFGELDEEAAPGTPVVRLPSYTAMSQLAAEDEAVKMRLAEDRAAEASEDFGETASDGALDTSWMKQLEVNTKGEIRATRHNIVIILENDHRLKGRIALNDFTGRSALRGDLPWRKRSSGINWNDRDDEALRHYLERRYGINNASKTHDAVGVILIRNRFHPVREYLESLTWDGTPRVETLLIDLLGAADTTYVRAVTRKALAAAVARVMQPGCKYDNVLVLVGAQGIGKSLLLAKLGREWFSDSLTTVMGKEAYEQLQGAWILELGELAATRRAETEAIKHFISKQKDSYRVAYGRQTTDFPRQCVFFGTTNDDYFLRDPTGNRRFWPVKCHARTITNKLKNLSDDSVGQIWAEALEIYKAGEKLYLEGDVAVEALTVQEAHREESERAGAIREFLELPLPEDWERRSFAERRAYVHGTDFGEVRRQGKPRDRVCVMEVWVELFNGDPKQLHTSQAKEIHDVLRTTPGWKPHDSKTGKLYFGSYGHQRAYVRTDENGKN